MRSRQTIATPPGTTIREQLENRGMTQKEFAVRMVMSEKHISQLINGEVHLTPNVALRLESVLGISASFWNNLEARYREKLERIEEENAMDSDIELLGQFPYAEMVRLGWIDAAKSVADKVRNLRRYFEAARLSVISNRVISGIAYRRTAKNEEADYSLAVWAQKAKLVARDICVSDINLQRLSSLLPELRALTLKSPEDFSPKLLQLMSECGIAVVFLPHMKSSFLHGATFFDGKKIVMGLTLRRRYADIFWFSFFHELDHVLDGHISKPCGPTDEDEAHADLFACNILIPAKIYSEFIAAKSYTFASVTAFAKQIGVAPGIVVGRLQRDNYIRYNQLNALRQRYRLA